MSPRNIFEKLLDIAFQRSVSSYPDEHRIEYAKRDGLPIPDNCKPGGFIREVNI